MSIPRWRSLFLSGKAGILHTAKAQNQKSPSPVFGCIVLATGFSTAIHFVQLVTDQSLDIQI